MKRKRKTNAFNESIEVDKYSRTVRHYAEVEVTEIILISKYFNIEKYWILLTQFRLLFYFRRIIGPPTQILCECKEVKAKYTLENRVI